MCIINFLTDVWQFDEEKKSQEMAVYQTWCVVIRVCSVLEPICHMFPDGENVIQHGFALPYV